MKPPNSALVKRPPATALPLASLARKFDPTQLFAQRDRLPWVLVLRGRRRVGSRRVGPLPHH